MKYYDINIKNGAYNGRYKISKTGSIITLNYNKTGEVRELKQRKNPTGRLIVGLYDNSGKQNWHTVHQLVALTFIDKPDSINYYEVNHIDENVLNNNVNNLEWVTKSENINHGTRNKRVSDKLKVQVFCSNGEKYDSVTEAAKSLRLDPSSISKVCRGKYKTCGGYTFKYVSEVENNEF